MINPVFTNKYDEESFAEFIQGIIPNLSLDKKQFEIRTGFKSIQQIAEVSESKLDLVVFVAKLDSSLHARVEITKNTYAVLKNHARSNALVAYISDDSSEWRLSLVTTKVTRTKDGIKESISNPRRFSYVLGPHAKVATPSKMLLGTVDAIIDLENKFSLAVVSKEFFTQIATQYSKLVGGMRDEGRKAVVFERTLKIGTTADAVNANFAIRLIGRLVFCWFLKQKKGHLDNPLIPSEILSVSAVKTIGDYYHSVCVPLFFEVLNKPQPSRPTFFSYAEFFDKVPFLNGGLFQDHAEDNHKFNRTTGMSERRGVVNVPDVWFSELFQIFEEYNFTIDENTSIDTELSIDPEMLGRIFENLLAEVNPETGASARKSTGSFYTPREIVDFMVEESLIAHLKTKTNISEEKLRALSSYNLDDDASQPVDQQERKLLVEAIHNTTVLDPACGSGAFPIGVLQRLVHMLGVLDPECSIYLSKIPPEMRRQLQRHSLTYVRKLGVIRECIHGVDIQPIAIDISRLRCFLTLVVDQQVDDNAPNRGIEPLPNLDFKFVCANTLIKPPVHEGPLFGDEFADALGELIDEYFAPVDQLHKLETARKLHQLISDKTKKELENILKSYSYVKDEKYKKVLAQQNEKSDTERLRINNLWDSYKNIFENKPVGFFDTRYFFPIVGRNGGFDIVIGNPPYVQIKQIPKNDKLYYINNFKFATGRFNLFYFFIEITAKLTHKDGIASYIVPDRLLLNTQCADLRDWLLNEQTIIELDSFDESVFDSAVVDSIILLYKNSKNASSEIFARSNVNVNEIYSSERIKIPNSYFINSPSKQFDLNYTIDKSNLIEKIRISTKPLGDISETRDGIIQSKIPDVLFLKNKDNKFCQKLLFGKDLNSYQLVYDDNWVNYQQNEMMKIELSRNGGGLRLRTKDIFEREKILTRQTADKIIGTIDTDNYYYSNTLHGTTIIDNNYDIKFILALLNSKVLNYYYKATTAEGGKVFAQVKIEILRQLPIKNSKNQKAFIEIVDKILTITKSNDYIENPEKQAVVKEYEHQIDQMVYKLYDLTPEEIKIVENFTKN